MTTTRAFRGARCALHGLSSDEDGQCALCSVSRERTRAAFARHSSWLLAAATLCAGGVYWLERTPPVVPKLSRSSAPTPAARDRAESSPQRAGAAQRAIERDGARYDEDKDEELSELPPTDSWELIPAEDHHLGESAGVKPSGRIPAPRVPDPPAPAAIDRETPAPDDPHDFDLPPPGPQTPWRPPL